MKRFLLFLLATMASVCATYAADDIFLPSSDCYPDPVLDSLTIQNGHIYVEDHVITSGELSYVMHKVNPTMFEQQKLGQKIYLISMGGIFLGSAAICTGSYWIDNFSGTRQRAGRALLGAGIPVTAIAACSFTVGVVKAHKARKQFLRNCFGLSYIENVNVGVGPNAFSISATF